MPVEGDLILWTPSTWKGLSFRKSRNIRGERNIRRGVSFPLTVISQYEHSRSLRMLLQGEEFAINPVWSMADFWAKVFHPRTAMGWGLDCWARIVGISRTLQLKGLDDWFGFFGGGYQPFGQAPFYDPEGTSSYTMDDPNLRKVVFFKAAINITDGTMASLNRIMSAFYKDRGEVMVIHIGTMRIRFLFTFELSDEERAMVLREDIPPVPAGVGYEVMTLNPEGVFGFAGSGLQPFNHGTFVPANGVPTNAYSVSTPKA